MINKPGTSMGFFLRQLIFEIIAVIVYLFPNPNKHPTSIQQAS